MTRTRRDIREVANRLAENAPGQEEQENETPRTVRAMETVPEEAVERETDDEGPSKGPSGAEGLAYFMRITPLFALFCKVATKTHGHKKGNPVLALRKEHKKFYGICIALDMAIRTSTVAGIFYLLMRGGIKALS